MATTTVHRCFACPLPHHATFWTTDSTTSSDDLLDLLARHGYEVLTVRLAEKVERQRYTGSELDPARVLWIATHTADPTHART